MKSLLNQIISLGKDLSAKFIPEFGYIIFTLGFIKQKEDEMSSIPIQNNSLLVELISKPVASFGGENTFVEYVIDRMTSLDMPASCKVA
jgi:hypothetical protein